MIFSGTEKMRRYPTFDSAQLGILSYGKIKLPNGESAYKAPMTDMERLASAGWRTVGNGKSYLYVKK